MEKKKLTDRRVFEIGTWVGFSFMLLLAFIFSLTPAFSLLSLWQAFIIGLPVLLFGILGARIGNSSRGTEFAAWLGAILGGIVGLIGWMWLLISANAFSG